MSSSCSKSASSSSSSSSSSSVRSATSSAEGPAAPISSQMPSGSPRASWAILRRYRRTIEVKSPALESAKINASACAMVVLVIAPQASQFWCSRNSSSMIRLPVKPRPARRFAAFTLYRLPAFSSRAFLPLTLTTRLRSLESSSSSSTRSTAPCHTSSAVSRSWAVPMTSGQPQTIMNQRARTCERVLLPFWRAIRTTTVLNLSEPSGSSSNIRQSRTFCHGYRSSPNTSRAKSMTS
ncbi:hypothetical protein D3C73_644390 [compost metagenome]